MLLPKTRDRVRVMLHALHVAVMGMGTAEGVNVHCALSSRAKQLMCSIWVRVLRIHAELQMQTRSYEHAYALWSECKHRQTTPSTQEVHD